MQQSFTPDQPFADGPTGGTPITAAKLNNMESQYGDAMQDASALYGHDVRAWAPSTVYAQGQAVVSPSGDVVTAATAHTSTATYSGLTSAGGNWVLSSTFNPKAVPALAGVRAGRFNPALSLYNATPANMRGFRQAIGKLLDGQLVTFSFLGDSKIAGYGTNGGVSIVAANSAPGHFRQMLGARGYSIAGTGPVFASQHASTLNDSRWSFPGWTAGGTNNNFISASSAGAAATFTSDLAGTVVEINSLSNSAPFTYSIDGGAAVTVTPSGSNVVYTTTITGLANTTHTVVLTTTSATLTYILSVNVRGTSGLQIANHGICSSTATDWTQTNFYQAKNVAQTLPSNGIFLSLGINDSRNGISAATFKTNMTTIITGQTGLGRPLMLLVPTNPQTTDPAYTNWAAFVSATYDLSDTLGVPLLDLGDVQGAWTQANTAGLTFDGLHEDSAGYAVNAAALVAALRE